MESADDSLESGNQTVVQPPASPSPNIQAPIVPSSSVAPQPAAVFNAPPDVALPQVAEESRSKFKSLLRFNRSALMATVVIVVFLLLLAFGGAFLLNRGSGDEASGQPADKFAAKSMVVHGLSGTDQLLSGQAARLTINGELTVKGGLILSPQAKPSNPQTGQFYVNSTDKQVYYYNGTKFVNLVTQDSLDALTNSLSAISTSVQALQTSQSQFSSAQGASGLQSVQGTANQVNVSTTGGVATISLPQGIAPGSDVNFNSVNVNTVYKINGVTICDINGCLPTGASGNYVQNGTTPQVANFNITGSGVIGTDLSVGGNLSVTGTVSGNGSGLTNLNASNVASGSLSDARLSSNVALLNGSGPQTFTGNNRFNGTVLQQTALNSITAFQINNNAAVTTFSVDTINGLVGIGTAGPGYKLDVQGGDINTTGIYRINGSQISSSNLSNDANLAKLSVANVFGAANTFASTVAIQGANSLTLGSAGNPGSITFNDGSTANTALLRLAGALGSNAIFDLPVSSGAQTLCTVQLGNCAGTGSGITGSGSVNRLAKFDAAQHIVNSSISDDGTTVSVSVGQVVQGAAGLTLGVSNTTNGLLVLRNNSNANSLTLRSGATGSNLVLTLPTADGGSNDCLKTNGSGSLAFASCTGGPGGGVTSVNSLSGVLTVQGTANQVNVASGGSTITLSTPQDINITSNILFRTVGVQATNTADNLFTGNALSGATGKLLDLKVNNVSQLTVDPSGNVNITGQYQVNGSQISSANLSNDANLAKLNGTGPQNFTGNNRFSGTVLTQLDSATAFQIQNSTGTSNLLVANTNTSRVGIGVAAPNYTLDSSGDVNTAGVYRINGIAMCSAGGCTPTSGSNNYIQNGTAAQSSNFFVQSATSGTVAGRLKGAVGQSVNIFEVQDSGSSILASIGPAGRALFKNSTDSTTAFRVQNSNAANVLNVDTITTPNLISVGDFEANTSGWAVKGAAAISATNSDSWQGNASLFVAATTAANDGAFYSYGMSSSTQYTLSFYAKVSTGTITDVAAGRQDNGSDINCLTGQTLTTNWTRFSCTFTTGGSMVNPSVYIKKTGVTSESFFVDGVQLQTGASATPFNAGGAVQFGGYINSPVTAQNRENSTSAFQIQNSAGTSNLFVADTVNTRIGIAKNNPAYTLDVTGDINTTTNLRINGTKVCGTSGCLPSAVLYGEGGSGAKLGSTVSFGFTPARAGTVLITCGGTGYSGGAGIRYLDWIVYVNGVQVFYGSIPFYFNQAGVHMFMGVGTTTVNVGAGQGLQMFITPGSSGTARDGNDNNTCTAVYLDTAL